MNNFFALVIYRMQNTKNQKELNTIFETCCSNCNFAMNCKEHTCPVASEFNQISRLFKLNDSNKVAKATVALKEAELNQLKIESTINEEHRNAPTAKELAAKINAFAALAEEKERENTERNEEIVLHFFKY